MQLPLWTMWKTWLCQLFLSCVTYDLADNLSSELGERCWWIQTRHPHLQIHYQTLDKYQLRNYIKSWWIMALYNLRLKIYFNQWVYNTRILLPKTATTDILRPLSQQKQGFNDNLLQLSLTQASSFTKPPTWMFAYTMSINTLLGLPHSLLHWCSLLTLYSLHEHRVGRAQLYRLSLVDAHTVAQNQYTGK